MTADVRHAFRSEARSELIEQSILPVWLNQRVIGLWGYVWIWVGIAVIIATYSLGANGVGGGVPLGTVVVVIFLANLGIALFMTLTADIGTEHGVPFAVYLRAPFGILGAHLPAVSRGVVAAMWFGIQTYLGALALNGIVEYLTGFENWVVWYLVFGVVQVVNTALGIKAVERLAALAAPCMIAISIWMYFTLEDVASASGINIWTWAGAGEMSILVLFVANLGFWSTLAIDIPNLTRFVRTKAGAKGFFERNRNIFAAQLLALPLTQAGIALIGAVSFIATGNWNPIEVIQGHGNGISLVVLLALVILAQWSTNNSANLIPSALTFINLAPRHIDYKTGVALAGVIGTLCLPWELLDNLFVFLGYYGAFLSAIGGIMVADYYLIRRRRLNVPDLYRKDGQFSYTGGFNWAGLIAWTVAGGTAMILSDYAFLVGFPLGLLVYVVLMKTWVMKACPQQEIESGFDRRYLATSEGLSWIYNLDGSFSRLKTEQIAAGAVGREDL